MPSTSLRDLSYDPVGQTLDVTFVSSGRRYRYFEVTAAEYDALRQAFSKGRHFNTRIKPHHDFVVLSDPGTTSSSPPQVPFLRP